MRPATLPAAAAQRTSDRPAAARDGKSLRSLELALAPLAKRYAIGRTPVDRNDWDPGVLAGPPSGRVVQQVVVVFDERGLKSTTDVVMGSRWSSFHPHHTIFGLDDGLYMLRGPSELLRWPGRPVPARPQL